MVILKLLRVKQWIKNGFVFVPLIFSMSFLSVSIINSAIAFFAFCFASSFIYIINDIADRNADALHPKKKLRPIASGKISVPLAIMIDILCLTTSVALALYLGQWKVGAVVAGYIILNLFYSWKLKHIALIDVFCIAFGFILRVYAGAYAVGVTVSSFLFLVMLFVSLFLAFGKRKSELSKRTRRVLSGYKKETIDKYLTLLAGAVIVSYALYTLDPNTLLKFGNRLIYSVIFVVYGIFRYMAELDKSDSYDDPTDNLYKDKMLIATCVILVSYIVLIAANII